MGQMVIGASAGVLHVRVASIRATTACAQGCTPSAATTCRTDIGGDPELPKETWQELWLAACSSAAAFAAGFAAAAAAMMAARIIAKEERRRVRMARFEGKGCLEVRVFSLQQAPPKEPQDGIPCVGELARQLYVTVTRHGLQLHVTRFLQCKP